MLEQKVETLERLPGQVAALVTQIAQLRVEVRDEFSAIRAEMAAGDEETRTLMRILHEDVVERIKRLHG
jgi:predicted  nucleic acid-binding Zn-ribbon protein